jgi:hypothetical protein
MAEMVTWLLIVVGSCTISAIIAGIVPVWNKSRSVTIFVAAWLGASALAYLFGLAVAVIFVLPSVHIVYDHAYALNVAAFALAYALNGATFALPCGFVPALAMATLVCTNSPPQTKRVSYRDTLLISCIFTAILYFYPLVTLQWAQHIVRPFQEARTHAPFLIVLTLATMQWLWTYWYFFVPTIFLPCFFVAGYRNAQINRIAQSMAEDRRPSLHDGAVRQGDGDQREGLAVSLLGYAKRRWWLVLALVFACSLMMVDVYQVSTSINSFGEWRLKSKRSRVQFGMSKPEVYSILGKPLGTGPEYGGRGSSDVWQKGRISFYVHFDDKDRVKRTETVDVSD